MLRKAAAAGTTNLENFKPDIPYCQGSRHHEATPQLLIKRSEVVIWILVFCKKRLKGIYDKINIAPVNFEVSHYPDLRSWRDNNATLSEIHMKLG